MGPIYLRLDGVWLEENGYPGLQVRDWQCVPGPLVPADRKLIAIPPA